MIQNNIKTMKKARGFTIVELLVVIVVIGILASITIVSYVGISARANTTKAQSNAASAQSVAEVMAADNTYYPATAASFTTGSESTKLPSSITVIPDAATFPIVSGTGGNTVAWACLTSCTNPTGGRIRYFDFTTGAASTTYIYVGAATSGGTFVYPAS